MPGMVLNQWSHNGWEALLFFYPLELVMGGIKKSFLPAQ